MTDLAVPATLPVVRDLLDQARRKNYRDGVLGVRTRPEWPGSTTFLHEDTPVTVVPCVSTLAVREALLERRRGEWLVILTDRDEADLGAGVLSHLVHHRLRTPDPWEAVRHRFAATGIDPALTGVARHRDLATGLLAAAPAGGWPPAPGGVLTVDHALASVAREHLGLTDPTVDATAVLAWTADEGRLARIADLRGFAGDVLVEQLLIWLSRRTGAAAAPLLHLLRAGVVGDVLPLGLVMGVLADARESGSPDTVQVARDAFIRLEPRLGGGQPQPQALRAWAGESVNVVTWLLRELTTRPTAERLLARADVLMSEVHGTGLADRSDLLPGGLTRRLAGLAEALQEATPELAADLVPSGALVRVERAWSLVERHALAEVDRRTSVFRAAVRLARWLSTADVALADDLSRLVGRHSDADAWVDSAVNDAARGVDDRDLGTALANVLRLARHRRARHDVQFAAALAAHTADDPNLIDGRHAEVIHLEDILPSVVLPLARKTPVLLLVLDGMSVGVGHEVMADVLKRASTGWVEALLPGLSRRAAAIAVLPTLTEVSRSSLLSGELRAGGQDIEKAGYAALTSAHGLSGASLFHKKPLDSAAPGFALAHDVGAAIDDVEGHPLVTCVLNTIDDALDRSDPSGTEWGADAVRHLAPLLARARRAGRTVVVTADHGHVVERREGVMRPHPVISSARSREAVGEVSEGEVLVTGRRVLAPTQRVILAVDEGLRYGPLKAGYHGGAAAAEVVVPVTVLVNGQAPEGTGLQLAVPQEPAWWNSAPTPAAVPQPQRVNAELGRREEQDTPTLFDEVAADPVPPMSSVTPSVHPAAAAVLASRTYRDQRSRAGRAAVKDEQVASLLSALLTSAAGRLPAQQASVALNVPTVTLRGAVPHVQRLLNVEGYGVLTVDVDGSTLVLDRALLRDQFEVDL